MGSVLTKSRLLIFFCGDPTSNMCVILLKIKPVYKQTNGYQFNTSLAEVINPVHGNIWHEMRTCCDLSCQRGCNDKNQTVNEFNIPELSQ